MRLHDKRLGDWWIALSAMAVFVAPHAFAQEGEAPPEDAATEEAAVEDDTPQTDGLDPEQPRSMSGMSILGNEEAPKSLVIIPWKSSQLGDDIDLENSLDDQATPVDKEVFLRELRFYEIRAGQ